MTEHRTMSLAEVFEESRTNPVIGTMKVSTLLQSLPGIGKVRAQQLMERLGVTARSIVGGSTPTSVPRWSASSAAKPRSA